MFASDIPAVDYQGFAWRLPAHRKQFQKQRTNSGDRIVPKQEDFPYQFKYTSKTCICSVASGKQRNNLYCTGDDSVYYLFHNDLRRFNPIFASGELIIGASRCFASGAPPRCKAVAANESCAFLALQQGTILLKHQETSVCGSIQFQPPSAINELATGRDGSLLLISQDNGTVSMVDCLRSSIPLSQFQLDASGKCSRMHPEGNLLLAVDETPTAKFFDLRCNSRAFSCKTPFDHSSDAAWRGRTFEFAICSDAVKKNSCLVWDARSVAAPHTLISSDAVHGVSSCKFSPDSQFLALAEPDDFVHIVTPNGIHTMDFIGTISGVDFSPSGKSFFIGIDEEAMLGGIIHFEFLSQQQLLMESLFTSSK